MTALSCIDCEDFAKCQRVTRAWWKAWLNYPGQDQASIDKRLILMQTQYSICHEKQATFQTFTRSERCL
jgi:hypothetical protein